MVTALAKTVVLAVPREPVVALLVWLVSDKNECVSNVNKLTTLISWENVDDVNNFSVADCNDWMDSHVSFCCDRCQRVYHDAGAFLIIRGFI